MDEQFTLPGTKVRFGLDTIIGLFPGLGDVITSAISLLIVHHAWQTGASPLTLARMLGNIGVDFAVGAVPVLGARLEPPVVVLVSSLTRQSAVLGGQLTRHNYCQRLWAHFEACRRRCCKFSVGVD
jgi:Domain of unknown function (DUF4112)